MATGTSQSHPILNTEETNRQRKLHNGRVVPKHSQTPHATVPPIKQCYIPECDPSTVAVKVAGISTCTVVLLQLICPG